MISKGASQLAPIDDAKAGSIASQTELVSEAPIESFGGRAIRGGIAVGGAQVVRVCVQMISVVLLSRLLHPEDFGIVAEITPVIAFLTMFQDLGYGQAIVQRPEITDDQLTSIFWSTTGLGLICTILTITLSPVAAWFFHEPRLTSVMSVVSLPILLGSLMSVPSGILNRRLNFRALAISDVCSSIAGLFAGIVAALCGMRYWSLVVSSCVSSGIMLAGYWASCRWRPGRLRIRLVDPEIGRFGANLTGFTFVNYFSRNLDNILIGKFAGSMQLGYYDRAYKLLYFPIQNINGPIARVVVPLLSRVQTDKQRFRQMYIRSANQLTLLIVPGMAAMVAVSHELILLLFGERWLSVAPIFFFLGVCGMLQPLGNSTGWIFIAQGRTDMIFRVGIYSSFVTILSFIVGLHYGGAIGLAAAYCFVEYVLKPPVLYAVLDRIGPVTGLDFIWIQAPLLFAGGLTLLLVHTVLRPALNLSGTTLIVSAGFLSYTLALIFTAIRPGGKAALQETAQLLMKLFKITVGPLRRIIINSVNA